MILSDCFFLVFAVKYSHKDSQFRPKKPEHIPKSNRERKTLIKIYETGGSVCSDSRVCTNILGEKCFLSVHLHTQVSAEGVISFNLPESLPCYSAGIKPVVTSEPGLGSQHWDCTVVALFVMFAMIRV